MSHALLGALLGREPPAWAPGLLEQVLERGWPTEVRVGSCPASDRTAGVLAVALVAMAQGGSAARRRIVLVSDRISAVSEASSIASAMVSRLGRSREMRGSALERLASRLAALGTDDLPLVLWDLASGIPYEAVELRSIAQPAIVLASPEVLGGAVLFRAPGASVKMLPILAGLLSTDALVLVDESHGQRPLLETLEAVRSYQTSGVWSEIQVGRPIAAVGLSSMLCEASERLDAELAAGERRLADLVAVTSRSKSGEAEDRARLRDALVLEAISAVQAAGANGAAPEVGVAGVAAATGVAGGRALVVCNRSLDARLVRDEIEARMPGSSPLLLGGRMRAVEQEDVCREWMTGGRSHAVLVATEVVERARDLGEFSVVISEAAAIDALRLRASRLASGNAMHVLATERQLARSGNGLLTNPDPVYGEALARTWEWLAGCGAGAATRAEKAPARARGKGNGGGKGNGRGGQGKSNGNGKTRQETGFAVCTVVASGVDLLRQPPDIRPLLAAEPAAPVLLPTHLDLLCQTSPIPDAARTARAFSLGAGPGPEPVTVCWRKGLDGEDPAEWGAWIALLPPAPGEKCRVPLEVARAWLTGLEAEDPYGDLGRQAAPGWARPRREPEGPGRPALLWDGGEDGGLVYPGDLRGGEVLVVPAEYGGYDACGFAATSHGTVVDVADRARAFVPGRTILRLGKSLEQGWTPGDGELKAIALLRRWAGVRSGEAGAGEVGVPAARGALGVLARSAPEWLKAIAARLERGSRLVRGRMGTTPFVSERERGRGAADEAPTPLAEHMAAVGRRARDAAERVGLDDEIVEAVEIAGRLHDLGKNDRRNQVLLHGGDVLAEARAVEPIAHSILPRGRFVARRQARMVSGYPAGARHEMLSVALAEGSWWLRETVQDTDLALHLIASHHGHARPFAPAVSDPNPVTVKVRVPIGGVAATTVEVSSDHGLGRLGSGVAGSYWRVVRRYGWWGVAYLEACLRIADQRQAAEEDRPEEVLP
jgi:CRISPR-associated endonuclease/helicase Cas3